MKDFDEMAGLRIGVVGLGKMGSAFARRLLEQGYPVAVWNRLPEPRAAFADTGAVTHATLSGLVAGVDVIIVMLWGDEVAREVTLQQIVPAMNSRQILVEMSTLSPDMYETIEDAAQGRGVGFVAAPVLGNPDAARAGSLTVLPGGRHETLERVRDVLSSLGNLIEMPSARASAYLKLANNTVLGVVAETLGELLEFCGRAGVDRDTAIRLLTGTFQRVAQQKALPLLSDDSEPRFTLGALLKDLHLAREAAKSLHVTAPMLEAVVPEAEIAVADGFGDRDYIVLALQHAKQLELVG